MSMVIIRIPKINMDNLSEHIEKSLHHMGKAMQCIEEMKDQSQTIEQR